MTETRELIKTIARLQIRVIASSNRAHARRLIASITLRCAMSKRRRGGGKREVHHLSRIFKVRVRASRAVDTDVARHGQVRTPVWLAHHRHDNNLDNAENQMVAKDGTRFA